MLLALLLKVLNALLHHPHHRKLQSFLHPKHLAGPLHRFLKKTALDRFKRLTFAENCFEPLAKLPFARCSANTVVKLLDVLSRLAGERDKSSAQSVEEQQIYNNNLTGDQAWFSDSSDQEKQRFKDARPSGILSVQAKQSFVPTTGKSDTCCFAFTSPGPSNRGNRSMWSTLAPS